MESTIRTYLLSQSAITDLVSTRIFPGFIPASNTLPSITYHVFSTDHEYDIDSAAGFAVKRIQFDIWAETYAETKTIGEQLRQELQGYSAGSIHVVLLDNQIDLFTQPKHADETPLYHLSQQYRIIYEESVPSF